MGHGSPNGAPAGNGNGQEVGANLAFTKFLFVTPRRLDDAVGTRLRAAGALIARGFFNDFDVETSGFSPAREQPSDTIHFLVQDGVQPAPPTVDEETRLANARYVVQVSSKYRPRLEEIEEELRRRLGDAVEVKSLNGAIRSPRYSSAEMQHFIQRNAAQRRSGRVTRNAIIFPVRKNHQWWEQSSLERHAYFYPHVDSMTRCPVKGHASAAARGIPVLFRRLYYNPDGYERKGEFDFITYFECADDALPVFDQVCTALRDPLQNPEWRYVSEGPLWKGKRVLRW